MRTFIACSLLLFCLCEVLSAQSLPNRDDQSVRNVIAEYMAARNGDQPESVRRLFTTDADQLVSTGEWRRGIDNLVRGTSLSSRKEAGKSSITIETVRFLDREVAIVDGRYRTVSRTGSSRDMWTAILLKRVGQDWRITAIRNMLPAPSPSAPPTHSQR